MPLVTASSEQVNAYDLASRYLISLGWPNTSQNQRALASWFMAESARKGTSVNVVGNNPLNITTSTGNYRLVGSHKIAVYSTQQEGANAFANLIKTGGHNYPGIVSGFKVGNGTAAIKAIINSGWVTGGTGPSYWHGTPKTNLLQNIFNGLPGGGSTSNFPPSSGEGPGGGLLPPTSTDPVVHPNLADFLGKDVKLETPAQINTIAAEIAQKLNNPEGKSAADLASYLIDFIGHNASEVPLNLPGVTGYVPSKNIDQSAQNPTNPLDAIGNFFGHFIFYAALLGGGVLTLFGLYLITKEATTGGSAESIVSPVPVFIREGA